MAHEIVIPHQPVHQKCKCGIRWLAAFLAGTATKKGKDGADWWLKWIGKLPDYYITEEDAKCDGYIPYLGNLAMVAPGKMLTKGRYMNRNGHLPAAPNRIWYEADINYTWGYRGSARVVFSNDGLVFVTYDHYRTFCEII